jgi:hypothetical protein
MRRHRRARAELNTAVLYAFGAANERLETWRRGMTSWPIRHRTGHESPALMGNVILATRNGHPPLLPLPPEIRRRVDA